MASGYSVYEEENQHLQEGLRAKVSALKSVSVLFARGHCAWLSTVLVREEKK